MVDPMFMIIQSLRLFLADVTPTAVIPTAVTPTAVATIAMTSSSLYSYYYIVAACNAPQGGSHVTV